MVWRKGDFREARANASSSSEEEEEVSSSAEDVSAGACASAVERRRWDRSNFVRAEKNDEGAERRPTIRGAACVVVAMVRRRAAVSTVEREKADAVVAIVAVM
mmetsp:Transcript_7490/g.18591  ORF Transcript_7490/g.18591 Transcript_7490/m.18591 type:complete len:103 (+) Transcript_7490:844-1152(+)